MAVSESSGLLSALVLCACIAAGHAGEYCVYTHYGIVTYTTTEYCVWGCCATDCCDINTGAAVGISVGIIACVVLLGLLFWCLKQRRYRGPVTRIPGNACSVIQTNTTNSGYAVQAPGALNMPAPPPYPGTTGISNPSYA